VGLKKPDPAIFSIALDATELEPGEVIYVGDTDDDIDGARAAGVCPVLIQRNREDDSPVALDFQAYTQNGQEPSYVKTYEDVKTISELAELLDIV
jgi:FMN phosphatase YigB (HAD superfamily)